MCHRHGPGLLPSISHHLLAQTAPVCSSVNRSFGDTGPTAFEAGSWPLIVFRETPAKALSSGLGPGFSPRAPRSSLSQPELQSWLITYLLHYLKQIIEPPFGPLENGVHESTPSRVQFSSAKAQPRMRASKCQLLLPLLLPFLSSVHSSETSKWAHFLWELGPL